jgi:hypothetical protein
MFTERIRGLVFRIFSVVVLLLVVVWVAQFIPLSNTAVRNQNRVVSLLRQARRALAPGRVPEVGTVALGGGLTLAPERDRVIAGYIFKAHVRAGSFTVEARPVKVGKSGLFSLFRDEEGIVRFEPVLGRPADGNSRPWGSWDRMRADQERQAIAP